MTSRSILNQGEQRGLSLSEAVRFLRTAGFQISRNCLSRMCDEGLVNPSGQRTNYRIEELQIEVLSDIAVLKEAGLSHRSIKRFLHLQRILKRRTLKRRAIRSETKDFISKAREVGLTSKTALSVANGESHLESLTARQQETYQHWRELNDVISGGADLRNAGELLNFAEARLSERQRACERWISRVRLMRERIRGPFVGPKPNGGSPYFTYDR